MPTKQQQLICFLKNKIAIIFLVFVSSNLVFSQKIEFGLGGGVSHFKGDISPNFTPFKMGVGATGLFRYNFSKSVSFRGNVLFTTYKSDDLNSKDALYANRAIGAFAKGHLFEGSLIAEYNFLNRSTVTKAKDYTPYLFGGIGYSFINNTSDQFSEALKANSPAIPYGVGIKYRFKGPFSVCAEFGTRYTFTDDMDLNYAKYFGTSNTTTNVLNNDKITFGDTTRKDQYFFTSVTLTYTIFNLICP
jgi:Domain of unknown function (DUF6089)